MAIDAYLHIDGIKGESQDAEHQGWIEITSVHWGVRQPKSATASTAGGHTAERAELTDITFSKLADVASPLLFQFSAGGKTFPKAIIEFFRADGDGKRIKYFAIELENVLIAHVTFAANGALLMSESVGLKFGKIRLLYTQQKIGGSAAGNTAGGWDLSRNHYA